MKIEFAYGRKTLNIDMGRTRPEIVTSPSRNRASCDPAKAFAAALARPIGCRPFLKLFTAEDTVAIVIPDKTRPNAHKTLLPLLVRELTKCGISREAISFVIATGTHCGHSKKEREELLGKEIAGGFRIVDHDSKDKANLVYMGTTSRGTEVIINRAVAEADKVITVGVVGYHYYAGYNAGRKLIMPGVCAYESVQKNHSMVFNPPKIGGKNPKAGLCIRKGNPVSEDMVEAANIVGVDFSINLLLDSHKAINGIFAGHIERAHDKACATLDKLYMKKVPKLADLVVASSGGWPRDINYVQAHKALEVAARTAKPGGTIILFAECRDRCGSKTMPGWFRLGSVAEMEQALRKNFEVPGNTAMMSVVKAEKFRIYFMSSFPKAEVKRMRLIPLSGAREAERIIAGFAGKRVIAIPDATVVMPTP